MEKSAIDCNWGRYLALSKNGQYNQFGAGTAADFEFESLMTELKTKAAIEISKFDVTGSILEGTNLMKEVCRLTAGPKKNSIQRPRGESNAHEIKIDIEQEWISAEQNFEMLNQDFMQFNVNSKSASNEVNSEIEQLGSFDYATNETALNMMRQLDMDNYDSLRTIPSAYSSSNLTPLQLNDIESHVFSTKSDATTDLMTRFLKSEPELPVSESNDEGSIWSANQIGANYSASENNMKKPPASSNETIVKTFVDSGNPSIKDSTASESMVATLPVVTKSTVSDLVVVDSGVSERKISTSAPTYDTSEGFKYAKDGYVPKVPFFKNCINVPHQGQLMSRAEINSVTISNMRALEIEDPYKDDFYYHNFNIKKADKIRREEDKEGSVETKTPEVNKFCPIFTSASLNRRSTEELKKKIVEVQENSLEGRTREWEMIHKVLGHSSKSAVNHPRALLNLGITQEVKPETGKMFSGPLWNVRRCIENVAANLLKVEEMKYLIENRTLSLDEKNAALLDLQEVLSSLGANLGLRHLSESVIDATSCAREIFANPESTLAERDEALNSVTVSLEGSLDIRTTAMLLELCKGKKVVERAISLLSFEDKWALIPALMAILLARIPQFGTELGPNREQNEAEYKLLENIKVSMETSKVPPPLAILKRCLELIIAVHRGRDSLKSALADRTRSETLQALLQRGEKVSSAKGVDAELDWMEAQSAFLSETVW